MTIDDTPKATNNTLKKIILTNTGGRHWEAEFTGTVTHRDIQKLHRIIKVEFAKIARQRSVSRMMQRGDLKVTKPVEVKIVTPTPTPTPTSTPISQTKDMSNAS